MAFRLTRILSKAATVPTYMKSIEACAAYYGDAADEVRKTLLEGQEKALALDNRGPIQFHNGKLDPSILEAYSKYGFYVFENVLSKEELADIRADLQALKENFPTNPMSQVDAQGRPALGADCVAPTLQWSKPLGDPLGGTDLANGRHEVKLFEPEAAKDAPAYSPFILLGSLQFSVACLRTYAHPELLKVAAAVNGEDFTPFNETLFIKEPGLGAAVSWHQDGTTHWDSPDFDEGIHGFNFMCQVFGSTPVNGVWVVPGTHKLGKLDIKEMIAEAGSERLPGAVPMVCNPGDVLMSNRQVLHGSFANTGFEPRITVNMGFHRRSSVENVQGAGIHAETAFFDDAFIARRSRVMGYAINARKERFPDEEPFDYKPLSGKLNQYIWNEAAKADMKDYNLEDLSI